MAATSSCSRWSRCSLLFKGNTHLYRHQKMLAVELNVLRNMLYRSYASSVGKTASSMMKNSKEFGDSRKRNNKPVSKEMQQWMVKNPMRGGRMKPESTHWPSIFPWAKSYNPALVPIFFRMGRRKHNKPWKFVPNRAIGNLELMKIPNFFHLTPPAIATHCAALKPLCQQWPAVLDLSTVPLRITTRNYLFAGPSIYHPGSRKVKLQVYLKDLVLNDHAMKKMIKLVGARYDPQEDELTIVADRCPTRQQNRDYAMYLLTVLYYESWKMEPWEEETDAQEEDSDDEVDEKQKKKRRNPKRVKLLDNDLYRVNHSGKQFRMQIKVKV